MSTVANPVVLKRSAKYPMRVWTYKGLRVHYRPNLDGCGSVLAQPMCNFIDHYNGTPKTYEKLFEWCCGPAFIGFAMLAEGRCQHLCLGDINPDAIECVEQTIADNGLEGKVTWYLSDNFRNIPSSEKFDCVVSNPPNYYALNPNHFIYPYLMNDLRPNDPNWNIHRAFYAHVKQHLNPNADLFISEVEPFQDKVYIPLDEPEPYDVRLRNPQIDLQHMIEHGGLTFKETTHFHTMDGGLSMWMMVSHNCVTSSLPRLKQGSHLATAALPS